MARQKLSGPWVWQGKDLGSAADWAKPLPKAALPELERAFGGVQARGLAWAEVPPADFPLPALEEFLGEVADELEHGRGLVKITGLPVDRYSDAELKAIYWGLGVHLGVPRFQNAYGEIMGEIRDEIRRYGQVTGDSSGQPKPDAPLSSRARTRTNGPLRFHTDRVDVVSLLCVRPAKQGGISKVVNTPAIHNAMLERRPDLLDLLFQDYPRSRQGEEANGESQIYTLPVFAMRDGKFTSQYSRTFVEAAQRLPGVPKITPAQDEALDLLAELAEELAFQMAFEPGDIQLLNNHVTYHGRTAYADADMAHDRLLLRLWLSMPNSRALPAGFEALWGTIQPGALRGGIRQAVA
ncbi:MAG: taurine catabolism dioxygenase TauD [Alphaproteobacteria bacterium]|nr:taurine catabolism dioxygenase TauD [Alphaproteobacteria bacterium]